MYDSRVRNLKHQAEFARERAALATMFEDKVLWLNLARRWEQLANFEAAELSALGLQCD
jgi:hypothetical protein